MKDLVQVQPVTNNGVLVGMVGLDDQGRVYYGEVRGSGPATYQIKWALIEEK